MLYLLSQITLLPHLFLSWSRGLHEDGVVPCCYGSFLLIYFVCRGISQVAGATQ